MTLCFNGKEILTAMFFRNLNLIILNENIQVSIIILTFLRHFSVSLFVLITFESIGKLFGGFGEICKSKMAAVQSSNDVVST